MRRRKVTFVIRDWPLVVAVVGASVSGRRNFNARAERTNQSVADSAVASSERQMGHIILPYRYCGFVCVYVCTIIMSIFKVAMCRFIIFRQEHMDIKTYGHAVGVVRIALGDTVAYDTI